MATTNTTNGGLMSSYSKTALLMCGIVASVLYILMLLLIPLLWEEYSSITQTVSELSAIDSPTRSIWFPLGLVYTLLMVAFGIGVINADSNNRLLRIVGALMIAYGISGIYWPPMHLRGQPATLTDSLHIAWTVLTVVLMTTAISIGAFTFDRLFKFFSVVTLIVLITGGIHTSLEAPGIPKNLPTPSIGIWERLNIGAFLLWVVVLSRYVLRTTSRSK
jgi:hypothetical protein